MKKLILALASLFPLSAMAQNVHYADTVLAFSSEYGTCPFGWSSCAAIGAPDLYPSYGDNGLAWAPSSNLGITGRDWIDLGFNSVIQADSIFVYETCGNGGTDTVYVRNFWTGSWVMVWDTTAYDGTVSAAANVIRIGLPSSMSINAVRIAINNGNSPQWNEIDAICAKGSITTDIKEQNENPVSVFPNPSSGNFTLNFTKRHDPYTVSIYDMSGRLCFSQNGIIGETDQVQTDLQSGIYSIVINNETMRFQKKIIVE